jgi:hypothetical protein
VHPSTNSTTLATARNGIFVSFLSPDGVSAIEPVGVGFRGPFPQTAVVASLQIGRADRVEHRGDAAVRGFGPYEPPIRKRQGISAATAKKAAAVLDEHVRSAIDACLKKNAREN